MTITGNSNATTGNSSKSRSSVPCSLRDRISNRHYSRYNIRKMCRVRSPPVRQRLDGCVLWQRVDGLSRSERNLPCDVELVPAAAIRHSPGWTRESGLTSVERQRNPPFRPVLWWVSLRSTHLTAGELYECVSAPDAHPRAMTGIRRKPKINRVPRKLQQSLMGCRAAK